MPGRADRAGPAASPPCTTTSGEVAVDGLVGREGATVDYPEDRFRHEAGMLDGVKLIGEGRLTDRIWTKPADRGARHRRAAAPARRPTPWCPRPRPSSAYGSRPATTRSRPTRRSAPTWRSTCRGAPQVEVTLGERRRALRHRRDRPGVRRRPRGVPRRAWDGVAPVDMGVGGSIPFIATFQELFPRGGDPGHRRRGPARRGARPEREPAPRRVRPGLPGRGAAAAQRGRRWIE